MKKDTQVTALEPKKGAPFEFQPEKDSYFTIYFPGNHFWRLPFAVNVVFFNLFFIVVRCYSFFGWRNYVNYLQNWWRKNLYFALLSHSKPRVNHTKLKCMPLTLRRGFFFSLHEISLSCSFVQSPYSLLANSALILDLGE